jgi:UDP-N-acetylmuramoyl-L-alanyl-D-glutamate--2,6-diaminopimelate ligase
MEAFGGGGRPRVVVDYAHTPDALEKALRALRPHCRGRLLCVFGCGGERDREKRPRMGRIAMQFADRVILTDDNPRHEPGEQIIAEILRGTGRAAEVRRDRELAIRRAITLAGPDDIVLLAGKGHETEQIKGDERLAFSDRAVAERALAEVYP